MLLTMFLFQKWLGSPFPEDVWAWWLLMHWLQLQFTPREALPSVWICFAWQYSQACGHLCCLCTFFLPNFFLPVNFAFNMLWYSTPWTATPFSNDPLWLTLFLEGVNDRLLDHCQVSSVPHYCGFKEQEIYTVWMVIYWNSNVNIQIFWDTDFWLSLAVSSNHQNKKNKKSLKCLTLHVMNLKYIKEISYKKLWTFSPYNFFFRCTCTTNKRLIL